MNLSENILMGIMSVLGFIIVYIGNRDMIKGKQ